MAQIPIHQVARILVALSGNDDDARGRMRPSCSLEDRSESGLVACRGLRFGWCRAIQFVMEGRGQQTAQNSKISVGVGISVGTGKRDNPKR